MNVVASSSRARLVTFVDVLRERAERQGERDAFVFLRFRSGHRLAVLRSGRPCIDPGRAGSRLRRKPARLRAGRRGRGAGASAPQLQACRTSDGDRRGLRGLDGLDHRRLRGQARRMGDRPHATSDRGRHDPPRRRIQLSGCQRAPRRSGLFAIHFWHDRHAERRHGRSRQSHRLSRGRRGMGKMGRLGHVGDVAAAVPRPRLGGGNPSAALLGLAVPGHGAGRIPAGAVPMDSGALGLCRA